MDTGSIAPKATARALSAPMV
ncbi:hypothetical protein PIIN_10803 [Serendipita indica DSM 11827]|uniref:Uncharacterized protein n=1 Tax=Serendipita indica (strain DSM 11827) TaxID=1109443 RepID=G4TZS4_SERID|nr:hypothetical protein PIIN_10803 [Serendipita indica DSM 11827]